MRLKPYKKGISFKTKLRELDGTRCRKMGRMCPTCSGIQRGDVCDGRHMWFGEDCIHASPMDIEDIQQLRSHEVFDMEV